MSNVLRVYSNFVHALQKTIKNKKVSHALRTSPRCLFFCRRISLLVVLACYLTSVSFLRVYKCRLAVVSIIWPLYSTPSVSQCYPFTIHLSASDRINICSFHQTCTPPNINLVKHDTGKETDDSRTADPIFMKTLLSRKLPT